MFPRLREQIGTALDLVVEFSTLGEYRLAVEPVGAASALADAPSQAPQMGGVGAQARRAAVRQTVAGGAAGSTPAVTPAARRLIEGAKRPAPHVTACGVGRRRTSEPARRTPARPRVRQGAPAAGEQLCLAV
jgi:hypothetical protein